LGGGSAESIILVIDLVKGLFNAVNANVVLVLIIGNVTILVALVVLIIVLKLAPYFIAAQQD
jgi:hypothetical protein